MLLSTDHPLVAGDTLTAVSAGEGPGAVLLVEDEPAIARMLLRLFAQAGLRVFTAANPAAGLALVERYAPEIGLAFVDCHDDRGATDEFCRRLRAFRPRLPVLLAGGRAEATAGFSLNDSATTVVSRPYLPTDLVWQVRDLLGRAVA